MHSPLSASHSMAPSTAAPGLAFEPLGFKVPLMPSRTPTMLRFIATHMI